jgi:hypothetical protein
MQTNRELIRNRAYELWEQEGHKEGQPEDYWYRAERELGGADTEEDATAPDGGVDGGAGAAQRSAGQ